jgi:hypothetical protein
MSQPEQFEVLILGSGQGGESYWLGIWRDRGDGLPSWSAGGLGLLPQYRLPAQQE